jgi:5-methyltetrahydrofolate--homocysteine methyltransferase
MKEVGDRFGAGDLILPFVLQSAEVMKAAVSHLEGFLERTDGRSKGTVVLATVLGDVHDIGKNLVHTILENNGYTVHNLGKQVPVNTVLEKAEELGADAIGLSALLVSTSKQMPLCVQELHRRNLPYPVLLGGAAINPSFVRQAARIDGRGASDPATPSSLYPHGVFYCKDAFDGLEVMDAITDPDRREEFLSEWSTSTREKTARRAELVAGAAAARPSSVRAAPSGDIDPPEPPFLGVRVMEEIPLEKLFPLVDRNTLYRLHWGAKNAKADVLQELIRTEFEPRFQRYREEAVAGGWVKVKGAFGYFQAGSRGDEVVLFDPEDSDRPVATFPFPRQTSRERLCLSDFFRPLTSTASDPSDLVAIQLVTVRSPILEEADSLLESGSYSDGYFRHGFGVRLAEAAAEYVHGTIRRDLGLPPDQGLRYSWGYGACPDTLQHQTVFDLLPARERLGMDLTEFGALVPELSTAAIVVHHPEARYFSV